MHEKCGSANRKSSCAVNGVFPKGYRGVSRVETFGVGGCPAYRMPCDSLMALKNGVHMPNQWVAPRKPRLCAVYDAHIEVEARSAVAETEFL